MYIGQVLDRVENGGPCAVTVGGMEVTFTAADDDMDMFLDGPSVTLTASVGGRHVASGVFVVHGDGQGHFEGVWVDPEHRRKGYATALYDLMSDLGAEPVPSDLLDTDGKAFWAARKARTAARPA